MNKKINNLRWMATLAVTFAFTACSDNGTDPVTEEITLTTPVIELSGVQASSRVVLDATTANYTSIFLYLHDSEERKMDWTRKGYYYDKATEGLNWVADPSVTVTGGEGHYRAGIFAKIDLKPIGTMPQIYNTCYGYRGSIHVQTNGTFIPDEELKPQSSAVFFNLKDADGADIVYNGTDATSGMDNYVVYRIKPVGLAYMRDFVLVDAKGDVDERNGQRFPNGTAKPVPDAETRMSYSLTSIAYGDYSPGTYPATWEEGGPLNSITSAPTSAWPIFEVTYCAAGFEWSEAAYDYVPNGPATTWTVNYPAQQLTLEAGKLYTFTATLGANAQITLDKDAVSITPWSEGSTINVGR